jgi:hypothetical protein
MANEIGCDPLETMGRPLDRCCATVPQRDLFAFPAAVGLRRAAFRTVTAPLAQQAIMHQLHKWKAQELSRLARGLEVVQINGNSAREKHTHTQMVSVRSMHLHNQTDTQHYALRPSKTSWALDMMKFGWHGQKVHRLSNKITRVTKCLNLLSCSRQQAAHWTWC